MSALPKVPNHCGIKSGRVTVRVACLAGGKGSCTVPATESGAQRATVTASYGGAVGFAASTSPARTGKVTINVDRAEVTAGRWYRR